MITGDAAVLELEDQGQNEFVAAEVAFDDQRMMVDAVVLELPDGQGWIEEEDNFVKGLE